MSTLPPHVRLANEIADQVRHLDPDEAAAFIANHLRSFWERRMLHALLTHVDAGGADLDPLAAAAAARLRQPA
ncbi:formate dehydrogenase subunit delta [Actinophytocola gossypii]|uniref:Formate dehydrogenase subunit delta n=1 Tax=Actinophytocola gossypii TaxID=2812003 RepID=A0ABT2J8L0_9PSEU|nr:formate dehydrogenase subunit delta [Actinophytocola gossypii]MCT2584197.1 formate dehydrogenase subunit delta [Actinophytocola gossypii]